MSVTLSDKQLQCYGLCQKRTTTTTTITSTTTTTTITNRTNTGDRQSAPQCQEPLRMPNIVFGETSKLISHYTMAYMPENTL